MKNEWSLEEVAALSQPPRQNSDPFSWLPKRSRKDRYLGGVAGGIAQHYSLPVVAVRVVVFLTWLTGVGFGIYVLLWLWLPNEGETLRLRSKSGRRTPRNASAGASVRGASPAWVPPSS